MPVIETELTAELTAELFRREPFVELKSIAIVRTSEIATIIFNCCNDTQADLVLDLADEISESLPDLDCARIYVNERHRYGFPVKLYYRKHRSDHRHSGTDRLFEDL